MLLGLNDCPGKQPDTSWIWDVDFDAAQRTCPGPGRHRQQGRRSRRAPQIRRLARRRTRPAVRPHRRAGSCASVPGCDHCHPGRRAALDRVDVDRAVGDTPLARAAGPRPRAVARAAQGRPADVSSPVRQRPPRQRSPAQSVAQPSVAQPSVAQPSGSQPSGPQPSAPPLSGRRPPNPGQRRSARRPGAPKGSAR